MEKLTGVLKLSKKDIEDRVLKYLNGEVDEPKRFLYKDEIVKNNMWVKKRYSKKIDPENKIHYYNTTDAQSQTYFDVITNVLKKYPTLNIKKDLKCKYSKGKRGALYDEAAKYFSDDYDLAKYYDYMRKVKIVKGKETISHKETKLVYCLLHFYHEERNGFKAVDFQIRTSNNTTDAIDLLLRRGDDFYITEVKTFESSETLLRCILEIETYYEKLNDNFLKVYGIKSPRHIKKAILIDDFHNQRDEKWARELLKKYYIKLFLLGRDLSITEDC